MCHIQTLNSIPPTAIVVMGFIAALLWNKLPKDQNLTVYFNIRSEWGFITSVKTSNTQPQLFVMSSHFPWVLQLKIAASESSASTMHRFSKTQVLIVADTIEWLVITSNPSAIRITFLGTYEDWLTRCRCEFWISKTLMLRRHQSRTVAYYLSRDLPVAYLYTHSNNYLFPITMHFVHLVAVLDIN